MEGEHEVITLGGMRGVIAGSSRVDYWTVSLHVSDRAEGNLTGVGHDLYLLQTDELVVVPGEDVYDLAASMAGIDDPRPAPRFDPPKGARHFETLKELLEAAPDTPATRAAGIFAFDLARGEKVAVTALAYPHEASERGFGEVEGEFHVILPDEVFARLQQHARG